ncbi:MAG: Sir2 family NAD-dependent protein deacetylase [Acidobacteriota bacterium]
MLSCRGMEGDAHLLAEAIRKVESGLILVVTGAGVSAASGLPLFRGTDPDAIWNRDILEIGTASYFHRHPMEWWQWFLDRFAGLDEARPNAAHEALAVLERWQLGRGGDFLLVTQNVDTLHERAGSHRLIKVHGTSNRLRCSRHGCPLGSPSGSMPADEVDLSGFVAAPRHETLPRCPRCGALLRPHVLLFDELYDEHADYRFGEVRRAAERSALTLFAGTSFSVGVTELVLHEALGWRTPVVSIDPAAAPPVRGVTAVRAAAEEILPAICRALGV